MTHQYKLTQTMLIIIACAMMTGCETLMDLDRPLAPSYLMWSKPGISLDQTKKDLGACSTKDDVRYKNASMGERLDARSICMLQKGFTFVPRPEGYGNLCIPDGAFWHGIACKSYRGEYTPPLSDD